MATPRRRGAWPIVAAALAAGLLPAQEAPDAALASVKRFIEEGVRAGRSPSVALAVVREDRVIWSAGFGMADVEAQRPATADSAYLLASVSKSLTATGLMLLVDEGKVELDRAANDYLRDAKLGARVGRAEDITVRRLLNHTSGLPVHANFFYDGIVPPSRDETIRRYGMACSVPGSRWEYCNLGFGVLDHITGLVAAEPWGRFMERRLFDPLGMAHSSDQVRPSVSREGAVPYRYDVAGRFVRVPPYGFDHDGASALWSSANDLARFLRLHLNDGVLDGRRYFREGTLRAMQQSGTARSPEHPERGYGLGFFVEPHMGHQSFGHSGGMPGVATRIRAFPDDRAGYAVLLNASAYGPTNAAGFREEICQRLTRALFPDASAPAATRDEEKPPVADPGAFHGPWRGVVAHFDGDLPLLLEVDTDGTARAQFARQPPVKLEKVSFAGGQFSGRMEGVLRTNPGHHGMVTLAFRLRPDEQRLSGVCVAEAEGYFALSHWVSLEREPQP
jgi:CubicO group peptidase (beta-lactamase class C family)